MSGSGWRSGRTEIPHHEEYPRPVTTTRRRALIQPVPNTVHGFWNWNDQGTYSSRDKYRSDHSGNKSLNGIQITVSENHPNWRKRSKNVFAGDGGGPFFTQKRECQVLGGLTRGFTGRSKEGTMNYSGYYVGPYVPCAEIFDGNRWPSYQASSNAQLDAFGTTAIARCKPSQPLANLATGLIELYREGLPKLAGSALWEAKTAKARRKAFGGEYLNIEFGWKPLVAEIQAVASVIARSDELIFQYLKDADKQVRRDYEFPPIRSDTTTVFKTNTTPSQLGGSPGVLYTYASPQGVVHLRRKVERKVWFSGAFIYHLPVDFNYGQGMVERKKPLRKLLGLDLTPDTLWNVAPWSWAVDWFTNTGDLISNVQSWTKDGMVMRYGYLMEHVTCSDQYSFSGPNGLKADKVRPCTVTFVSETKQRRKATPFAFGQSYGSLSPRQLAIMAALGLSRW